jgi:hypothetical protein
MRSYSLAFVCKASKSLLRTISSFQLLGRKPEPPNKSFNPSANSTKLSWFSFRETPHKSLFKSFQGSVKSLSSAVGAYFKVSNNQKKC